MNLAQTLSHYVHKFRFEALPSPVIHEAKRRVIDSLGCALAAFNTRPGRITRKIAETGLGRARVIGTRLKTTPSLATFANSSLIRYWDYNDTYLSKEPAHPSDNLGALLAVVQSEHKTGKDFISALIIAYEIQCRLCDAASLRTRGWDHVTYGAFSVALGVGKLMNMPVDQLVHALGLSGVDSAALRQTRVGEISDWKASAFANTARNAVFACELARMGMTGPSAIFEGEKGFHRLVSGPFKLAALGGGNLPFKILETYIKFYPVEYHAQAAVEAALRLVPRVMNFNRIEKIDVDTYDVAIEIIVRDPEKWNPKSRETADHSLPYVIARSLLDGQMTLRQFSEKKIRDSAVLQLMKKIHIREDKKMSRAYPKTLPCRIRIQEKGAELLEELVEIPRGHYMNPMSDEEVEEKFIQLTAPFISKSKQKQALELVWNLERIRNWDQLMDTLVVEK